MQDDILHYKQFLHSKTILLLAIPKSFVIDVQHTLMAGGYSGVAKTLTKICAKYHWPTMMADIIKYVKNQDKNQQDCYNLSYYILYHSQN